jgi:hypothetical protein
MKHLPWWLWLSIFMVGIVIGYSIGGAWAGPHPSKCHQHGTVWHCH